MNRSILCLRTLGNNFSTKSNGIYKNLVAKGAFIPSQYQKKSNFIQKNDFKVI